MASVGIASWKLLDWFGQVNGIKNVSQHDAEDVVIHAGSNDPIYRDWIVANEEVELQGDIEYVSISWRDGAGMHAEVVRSEE